MESFQAKIDELPEFKNVRKSSSFLSFFLRASNNDPEKAFSVFKLYKQSIL